MIHNYLIFCFEVQLATRVSSLGQGFSLLVDFDSRLYGFKKLSDLVRSKSDVLELEDPPPSDTRL